jgi:hypothetical protein
MVDPGELVTKTLIREFSEEALSHELKFTQGNSEIETRNKMELELKKFFETGTRVNY